MSETVRARTVRLHVPVPERQWETRVRVERLLARADPGRGGGREVLLVPTLHWKLPAGRGHDPDPGPALRGALEELRRRAVRIRHPGERPAADAVAVLYASPDLLLLNALLEERADDGGWLDRVRQEALACPGAPAIVALVREPHRLPALASAARAAGCLGELANAVPVREAREILRGMARTFGLPPLEAPEQDPPPATGPLRIPARPGDSTFPPPPGVPHVTTGGGPRPAGGEGEPRERRNEEVGPPRENRIRLPSEIIRAPPPVRALLLAALALHERPGAVARAARAARTGWSDIATTTGDGPSSGPAPGSPPPAQADPPARGGGRDAAGGGIPSRHAPAVPEIERGDRFDAVPSVVTHQEHAARFPPREDPAARDGIRNEDPFVLSEGVPTRLGGLFFPLNLLPPADLEDPPVQSALESVGGWSVYRALLRCLVEPLGATGGRIGEDPAWEVLDRLAGTESPAKPPPGIAVLATRVARRLHDRVGEATQQASLARVLLRPARLVAGLTHVDVRMDLEAADLEIRRAGLDLDPGWVPWLGRIVLFHYEEP